MDHRLRHQFDGGVGEAAALRRERNMKLHPESCRCHLCVTPRRDPHAPKEGPSRGTTTLTDESPMPFGKYGPKDGRPGLALKNVPADYLLWLWDEGPQLHRQTGGLAEYIRQNFKVLTGECPDKIIKNPPPRDTKKSQS